VHDSLSDDITHEPECFGNSHGKCTKSTGLQIYSTNALQITIDPPAAVAAAVVSAPSQQASSSVRRAARLGCVAGGEAGWQGGV